MDEGLAQCVSNGCEYRNRQNKINAAAAAPAAAAATIATFNLANTSNITNTSISTFASTLINGNEITASFESTPPPSSDPSATSSLPSSNSNYETRAILDINSLSDHKRLWW